MNVQSHKWETRREGSRSPLGIEGLWEVGSRGRGTVWARPGGVRMRLVGAGTGVVEGEVRLLRGGSPDSRGAARFESLQPAAC